MSSPVLLRDPLTGAYSRAALEPRLAEEVERTARYGAPLALLLLDLDHLKSVNDAFGHARGDDLLRAFVARIQTALRASDLLFRYGGDEFVLLLPATTRAAARALAARLLALVAGEPFAGQPPLHTSASIGVAACPDDSDTPQALFALADQRLYEAKRRGRGCVVDEGLGAPDRLDLVESGRLVERDAAVQALRDFLEALPGQRRGVLTISGERGAGRTRLLLELEHMARLRGYVVALLRGQPGLRTRVYGALDEARERWPSGRGEEASPAALVRALLEACEQPDGVGLLLLVDDMAEVDAATLELLREALAACAAPAGLAYTALPAPSHGQHDEALLQVRVDLPPFTLAGVRLWLRSALRWEAPAAFAQWLFERVGGLPGALRHALERLEAQGLLVRVAGGWEVHAGLGPGSAAALGLLPRPPAHSLPELPTDFIGRNDDIRTVKRLVAAHPLLTLAGPGGMGKTRLALQAASELAARFADGACFVPLAGVTSTAGLALAVCAALGHTPPERHELGDSLAEYLQPRALLLVLDNAEQLHDELGLLPQLLRRAARLHLLITSRERLDIPGEVVWELCGLSFPNDDAQAAEGIEHYGAGQLFVQQARRAAPHFRLVDEDRPALREICQLVQGMPLGVELAAAWVGLFSCAEIASALRTNLEFMASSPAQQFAHGTSLRAVFDCFWDQLSPDEQRVARWLSVFNGSFSREIARDVAGASPFFLSALVHKAFLRRTAEGRYTLHELLRQYVAAQLASHPLEQRRARELQGARYLALAEQAVPLLRGPEQTIWLARLEAERSNLRGVLEWGCSPDGDPAVAIQLAAQLWFYWVYRAQVREASDWLGRLLGLDAALAPTMWRARLLNAAGFMALRRGDWREAAELLAESVELCRRHRDRRELAWALNHAGYVAKALGDLGRAERLQAESLQLARRIEQPWHAAWALSGLGNIAQAQGNFARARSLLEEALAIFRSLGDSYGVASLLLGLGQGALGQGDFARARSLLTECQQICSSLGDTSGEAAVLAHLGEIAQRSGDPAQGAALLRQSLSLRWDLGDRSGIAHCLKGLAEAAAASGQRGQAAWLHGAASTFNSAEPLGSALSGLEYGDDEALLATFAEGRSAGIDAAVRQALAWG
jgi:diguanylate cyclase (GGDEF)-like protein